MTKLYFTNPGELDIRALLTQGVSAKLGDHPIGKFGTGAKYAIAGILRLGGRIAIASGPAHYVFFSRSVEIRGKEFELVCCSTKLEGKEEVVSELGFTTALGAHWEPWMLYRELRANALDEGGLVVEEYSDHPNHHCPVVFPTPFTIIEVDCEEILAAHENVHEHWLIRSPDAMPLFSTPVLEVWPGETKSLFYRGMKCGEWPQECHYTYNFLSGIGLTEERSCDNMYAAKLHLGRELMKWNASDTSPVEWMLSTDIYRGSYERNELDWDWSNNGTASREFLAVVASLRKQGKLRNDKSWVKIGRGYPSALEQFIPVASPMTEHEASHLADCVAACESLGLAWKWPIYVSQDWEEGDWETHEWVDGELYISHWIFQHEKSWLVAKLCNLALLRDSTLSYGERDRWAFEQLLIAKGFGNMLPLPTPVAQDEIAF